MDSLRAAAAQCVFARLGSSLPPETEAFDDAERVEALLHRCPVGGVLLFNARWPDVTDALARVQRAAQASANHPLLVASDVERGVGQQVHGATLFPHAMAIGATPDPAAAAAALARVTAREAQTCGIHLAFAPVADVNVEPRNPIIGPRAFASNADTARICVEAYVRTAREMGLLTTAKHFPGHGRTTADSHATLPVVSASREAWEAVDRPPFQAAFAQAVDAVMTAHVAYPNLAGELDDSVAEDRRPATASPPILRSLLRDTCGFQGVVVSDSLLMEGIRDAAGADPGRQAARLLAAGVDVLVDPADPEAVVDGLVAAVEAGDLAAERVEEACDRVLEMKRRIRDAWGEEAFLPSVKGAERATVGHTACRQTAADIAQQALQVVRQTSEARWPVVPSAAGRVVVVHLGAEPSASPTLLERGVRGAYDDGTVVSLGSEISGETQERVRETARHADHVLVAGVAEPAAWSDFGLSADQKALVQAMAGEQPVALAALGSPLVLEAAPTAAVHVCTYSTVPDAHRALVAWMTGELTGE